MGADKGVPRGLNAETAMFLPNDLDQVIVRRGQAAVRRRDLLADASAMLGHFPTPGAIVNCCRDRYNFLVVFTACLLRGTPAILPNDKRKPVLDDVSRHYPGCHFATDQQLPVDPEKILACAVPTPTGSVHAPQTPMAIPSISPAQPAAVVFSSGSTGTPVPTVRTWEWLVTGAADYADALGLDRLQGCNIVATVPLQHSYGLETACMLPMQTRAAVSSAHPFFPADIARALAELPVPRVLVTTPHHLDVLHRSDVVLPETALIVSATAPLADELARASVDRLGGSLIEIYGCTEVGLVGARETLASSRWTVGKSLTISINDELAEVDGPHLPAPALLDDVISEDGDRHFHLTGRRRDIVKIGGNRMSMEGMNQILRGVDGVVDGILFQSEDEGPAGVDRITCAVVSDGRDLAAVRRDLNAALPKPFWPRYIYRIDAVPRGPTGKVALADLKKLIDGAAESSAASDASDVHDEGEGKSKGGQTVLPEDKNGTIFVPADHPSFVGHFPGNPVLPGAVLLELVAQAAERASGREVATFSSAKFIKPVSPGSTLQVEFGSIETERATFRCTQGDELFASGALTFRPGP